MLTETVRQNEITEITVPSQYDILLLSLYTHSCLCPIESFEYSLHSESVKRIYSQVFIYLLRQYFFLLTLQGFEINFEDLNDVMKNAYKIPI